LLAQPVSDHGKFHSNHGKFHSGQNPAVHSAKDRLQMGKQCLHRKLCGRGQSKHVDVEASSHCTWKQFICNLTGEQKAPLGPSTDLVLPHHILGAAAGIAEATNQCPALVAEVPLLQSKADKKQNACIKCHQPCGPHSHVLPQRVSGFPIQLMSRSSAKRRCILPHLAWAFAS